MKKALIGGLLCCLLADHAFADTVFVKTLSLQGPGGGDGLGQSVASVGNNAIVGAPTAASDFGGRAYAFDGGTGTLGLTFQKPTPAYADFFGWSVASQGSDVLVGAIFDDTVALNAGAVYRFNGTTGSFIQAYFPPDAGGQFGRAIAFRGSDLVIGAMVANGQVGKAYVIDSTTGTTLLTLANPNPGTSNFGLSVGALGNDILVGGNGVVTVFDGTTGAVLRVLRPPTGTPGIGDAISVSGTEVLVSGQLPTTINTPMRALLYDGTTGNVLQTFTALDAHNTIFGNDLLDLGDGRVLIGGSPGYVFSTSTGQPLQALLPGTTASGPMARSSSGLLFTGVDVYTEQPCTGAACHPFCTGECNPVVDPCCDQYTCKFNKCDPSVDPCCSATTCDFVQCNPEANPCCDPSTCNFKATNALCVQTTGSGAGCKTGQCDAAHVCQPVSATNIDDGTRCISQVNPCYAGQCTGGVCQPPDGLSTPWADRCEDAETCTIDASACKVDVAGSFVRCDFKDPSAFASDGTSCSTTSGTVCTVKSCQGGQCQPVSPPQTIDCSTLPQAQTCYFNTCTLNAQGQPQCVAGAPMPAGTVCEATAGSTDWDCRHYRCSSRSHCAGKRATEGKVCDFAPNTTPAEHCQLGTCSAKAQCSAPLYSSLSVVQRMETAALNPDGTPVLQDLPTCPSDNNACTVDRCNGTSDACIHPCNVGSGCGCGGHCTTSGSSCVCQ